MGELTIKVRTLVVGCLVAIFLMLGLVLLVCLGIPQVREIYWNALTDLFPGLGEKTIEL